MSASGIGTEPHIPVGTPVLAYPGVRPEASSTATVIDTVTRDEPWLLGGHTWVVSVEGYPGGIALTHIDRKDPS